MGNRLEVEIIDKNNTTEEESDTMVSQEDILNKSINTEEEFADKNDSEMINNNVMEVLMKYICDLY